MKKLSIFLLSLLALAVVAKAQTKDGLYFTEAALMPGEMTNIELHLKSPDAKLCCIEAEICLPAGLSVVHDTEGAPIATLYRNCTKQHELLANVLDNGNLKLLISSADGSTFSCNEGLLMSFCVQAEASMPAGEYVLETLEESLLVNRAAEAYYGTGVQGKVLVMDDPTGVDALQPVSSNLPVYNLSGQRVQRARNGIFIQGGKKVYFK